MPNYVITYASGTGYCEYAGMSAWDKPLQGVGIGSFLHEVDTGKVFAFAGEDQDTPWVYQLTLAEDSGTKSAPKLSMGLKKSAPAPQDDEPAEEEPEEEEEEPIEEPSEEPEAPTEEPEDNPQEEAEPEAEEPIKDENEPEEATER